MFPFPELQCDSTLELQPITSLLWIDLTLPGYKHFWIRSWSKLVFLVWLYSFCLYSSSYLPACLLACPLISLHIRCRSLWYRYSGSGTEHRQATKEEPGVDFTQFWLSWGQTLAVFDGSQVEPWNTSCLFNQRICLPTPKEKQVKRGNCIGTLIV